MDIFIGVTFYFILLHFVLFTLNLLLIIFFLVNTENYELQWHMNVFEYISCDCVPLLYEHLSTCIEMISFTEIMYRTVKLACVCVCRTAASDVDCCCLLMVLGSFLFSQRSWRCNLSNRTFKRWNKNIPTVKLKQRHCRHTDRQKRYIWKCFVFLPYIVERQNWNRSLI